MKKIEVLGLQTVPKIKEGDNLAEIIVKCVEDEIGGLEEKDLVVLTSKIVSKAAGRIRKLKEVVPGKKVAVILADTEMIPEPIGKNPSILLFTRCVQRASFHPRTNPVSLLSLQQGRAHRISQPYIRILKLRFG